MRNHIAKPEIVIIPTEQACDWQLQEAVFGADRIFGDAGEFADDYSIEQMSNCARDIYDHARQQQGVSSGDLVELKAPNKKPFWLVAEAGKLAVINFIDKDALLKPPGERFGKWHIMESIVVMSETMTARTHRTLTHTKSAGQPRRLSASKPSTYGENFAAFYALSSRRASYWNDLF
jgi:hypothetical protein